MHEIKFIFLINNIFLYFKKIKFVTTYDQHTNRPKKLLVRWGIPDTEGKYFIKWRNKFLLIFLYKTSI